jgi:hypothetical protein
MKPMAEIEKILKEKKLPQVGQVVRSKKYGTLWRIVEKREVWQKIEDDPKTGEPRILPAVYLGFWRVKPEMPPGVGKMMGFLYTLYDNTFEANWQVVD